VCNACAAPTDAYRVVALFLHDTAAVRAYCPGCYPAAADGDYHAAGDGMLLDYAGFAARFGPPGPPPPPATPVDRLLTALIRDPGLRRLSPASEAIARRRRQVPYPVHATLAIDGALTEAHMTLAATGALVALDGDPRACARVRELFATR
jgi:hypothetical protein